jgi:predicted ATPase
VLATSREALGVEGEDTYEVRPLVMPAPGADAASGSMVDNDAIRLFAERARSVKRGFALSPENAPVVAEICQRLDGIPLAIELAAARLKMMSPAEVLAHLDERFELLAGGRRTVLERHQTLRAATDWSYELLDPPERLLFARLAVFAGGFTLEAAQAIAAGEGVEARDVLTHLGSLVAKSMVDTDDTEVGTRYRLLETLREYAWERLDALDDPSRVHARHAAHFLALVETVAPTLKGDDEVGVARLAADQDNVRAALGWARDHDEPETLVRLVQGLVLYWHIIWNYRETSQWTQAALEHVGDLPDDARAELLAYAGVGANYANRFDEAITLYEASLTCSREAGLPPSPLALANLGIAALESNHPEEAIARCEEALAAAGATADPYWEAFALQYVSLTCSLGGDGERGRSTADEALARARRLGSRFLIGSALVAGGIARVISEPEVALDLLEESAQWQALAGQAHFFQGVAHVRLGQPSEAAHALRAALPLMQESGSDFLIATVIGTAAGLLARPAAGDAVQLLSALDRFRADSGMAGAPADLELQRRTRAGLEESMAPDEFADSWALGAELSVEDAAALAHAALGKFDA